MGEKGSTTTVQRRATARISRAQIKCAVPLSWIFNDIHMSEENSPFHEFQTAEISRIMSKSVHFVKDCRKPASFHEAWMGEAV